MQPTSGTGDGASPGPISTVRISGGPLTPLAAIVLVMIAALALREMAPLVVPVLFGLFLALVAWPLVGRLKARGARHAVALTATLLVVLAIVVVVAVVVAFSIAELVIQIPKYEDKFTALVDAAQALLAGFGIELDPDAIASVISVSQVLAVIRPVASAASATGLGLFVLTFTMIYALAGASSLQARATATFGADHRLLSGMEQFGIDLRKYLLVRAQLGAFAAVLSAILLWVLGVPFPLLWAFLVFAASFIPNIGTFIAVVPPTILALLAGGVLPAVAVVVGYTLINFAQDHFLQPVVMGSELNLSPLVVFLSVLAWAWILGAAGALLAVPLTVALVAILEVYPSTARIAALLRNRIDAPPGLPDLVPDADGGASPQDVPSPTDAPPPSDIDAR
jgi:predicted PurR-regulated permease PerM